MTNIFLNLYYGLSFLPYSALSIEEEAIQKTIKEANGYSPNIN